MDDTQTPALSQKPSDISSDTAAMRFILRQFALDFQNMLPAQVVSYDRNANLVRVKPIIMFVDIRDKTIPRQELIDINALSLGAGGYHVSLPMNEGDLGWIHASDRDISLFKQTLSEQAPPTDRLHRFEDGLFVPDAFRNYTINAEDAGAMVIQSTNGATRISIRQDNIKITAPVKVLVDVPLTEFTKDVNINGDLHVNGNTLTDKTTTSTGGMMANGGFTSANGQACTLPASTTVAGKQVNLHVHRENGAGNNTDPF